MKLRFVRHKDFSSTLITAQEKTCMPFTPSHVEALTPDGKFYIGARLKGGVSLQPVGYDAGQIASIPIGYDTTVFPSGLCDLSLPLPATPEQDTAFYKYLNDSVGEPYDWLSILGFVIPGHLHLPNHAICSAKISLALRACKWFEWPLAAPAHLIDPRDLLLMISARMEVPGI